jgi:hypothetical protein
MWASVRGLGAGWFGVAVALTWGQLSAFGQAPQAANPNVYANPFAAAGRFPGMAAVGQVQNPAAPGRLGYGSLAPGSVSPNGSYGSLSASYANPAMGYGSLMNSGNNSSGGSSSGGYGMYGTQWMMNPYQGYLSGAADITRANSEYYQTIQQARLTREEARRSALQTRRALIEEIEWEREHMPDPEKMRQKALERELSHARVSPPLNDIWTARSLNALLHHLVAQQGRLLAQQDQGGAAGPDVPLNEDILAHINYQIGNTRGNVGLLKDGGALKWPLPLTRAPFQEVRKNIESLMAEAYRSASNDNRPASRTISDLRANYRKLAEILDANPGLMSIDESLVAHRYLGHLKSTIEALKDPDILKLLSKEYKPSARNVAELVRILSQKGLEFAPAAPADEPAYTALYHALASFDRGMQRLVRTDNNR